MKGKDNITKLYMRNYEFYLRGQDGPGPASGNPGQEKSYGVNSGLKFRSAGRDIVRKQASPGPGSYNLSPSPTNRTGPPIVSTFGSGAKKFDVR
jgi:hypothetical protein